MSRLNKKARTEISAGIISGMSTRKEAISRGKNYHLKAYDNGTNHSQHSKVEGEDRTDVEKAKVNENASRQPGTGIGGKEPLAELEEYEEELDDIGMEDIYLDELEELEKDEIEDETYDPPSSSEAIRSNINPETPVFRPTPIYPPHFGIARSSNLLVPAPPHDQSSHQTSMDYSSEESESEIEDEAGDGLERILGIIVIKSHADLTPGEICLYNDRSQIPFRSRTLTRLRYSWTSIWV